MGNFICPVNEDNRCYVIDTSVCGPECVVMLNYEKTKMRKHKIQKIKKIIIICYLCMQNMIMKKSFHFFQLKMVKAL